MELAQNSSEGPTRVPTSRSLHTCLRGHWQPFIWSLRNSDHQEEKIVQKGKVDRGERADVFPPQPDGTNVGGRRG